MKYITFDLPSGDRLFNMMRYATFPPVERQRPSGVVIDMENDIKEKINDNSNQQIQTKNIS